MKAGVFLQRFQWPAPAVGWQPWWLIWLALAAGLVVAILPLQYAAALVLGTALLLLMLIWPLFGLAVVLLAGPAGAMENHLIGVNLPESGQLLLAVTLSAWILRGVLRRRIIIHKTILNVPFAIFLIIGLVTLVPAASLSYGLKEVIKWVEMWLVMQMVLDLSATRSEESTTTLWPARRWHKRFDTRWLMAMLLVAGLSQALIGIWQFALRGDGPEHFMILERFYRAFGTFQQPNPYGGYMGLTASLGIGATSGMVFALVHRLRSGQAIPRLEWLWLAFFSVCAIFAGLGLIMSWSRGAWLGFAGGMVVFLFFLPRRRIVGLALLSTSAILLGTAMYIDLIPAALSGRLVSFSEDLQVGDVRGVHITIENYAVIERLAHWQAGADMARQSLLIGVGFGNYEPAYQEFALLNWPHPLGHAHNYYLNILAETGVFGALAYLILWALIFVQVIRVVDCLSWPQKGLALGLLA
ncbi:MAG: O-antigen ligase family protein, partial [Candidatus Promineifilaceae bacterium]